MQNENFYLGPVPEEQPAQSVAVTVSGVMFRLMDGSEILVTEPSNHDEKVRFWADLFMISESKFQALVRKT